MATITLITGGARSGKSAFAEKTALKAGTRRAYLATATVSDAEMAERISRHRQRRDKDGWVTLEEPLNPAAVIRACAGNYDVILVDCLTLWIGNLLYQAERNQRAFSESEMVPACRELESACREFDGEIVFVISETGLGIVPDTPLLRRFRDCSGICSQTIAGFADRVFLVCCGIPVALKTPPEN